MDTDNGEVTQGSNVKRMKGDKVIIIITDNKPYMVLKFTRFMADTGLTGPQAFDLMDGKTVNVPMSPPVTLYRVLNEVYGQPESTAFLMPVQ